MRDYPLYRNPDGSTWYRIDLWNGGYWQINDATQVESTVKLFEELKQKRMSFHDKLMDMDVMAYRYFDGWVDPDKLTVTFFDSDQTPWSYWGNLLKEGDKIFIGDASCWGRFAVITWVVNRWSFNNWVYKFKRLKETLDGYEMPYKKYIARLEKLGLEPKLTSVEKRIRRDQMITSAIDSIKQVFWLGKKPKNGVDEWTNYWNKRLKNQS